MTRPIPDRVKESLFSLLRGWTEDAAVLDVFAGTGAIGLEAVSRGAARCVFIERDRQIVELLRKNVAALGCEDRCEIVRADGLGPAVLSRCPRPVDLVFFDPPYPLVRDPTGWERLRVQFSRVVQLLTDEGFAVLRTPWPFGRSDPGPSIEPEPEGRPDRRAGAAKETGEDAWEELPRERWDTADMESDDESADRAEGLGQTSAWQAHDLSIEGAIGPETHVYGHTAIHLYMRKKETA